MFTIMTKVNSIIQLENKVLSNKEIKIIVNFQNYALKKKRQFLTGTKTQQTAIWTARKPCENRGHSEKHCKELIK